VLTKYRGFLFFYASLCVAICIIFIIPEAEPTRLSYASRAGRFGLRDALRVLAETMT